ncbi:hypothetical protein, partial [Fischerella thermalis]|uniref:hypothetical protein n=1 Tax=Fischerella thermalis TaxID=372787 RepID=UPI001CA4F489
GFLQHSCLPTEAALRLRTSAFSRLGIGKLVCAGLSSLGWAKVMHKHSYNYFSQMLSTFN